MDYTNFVRTYYRVVINKLSQFTKYNGSVVDVDNVLDIPNEKKHSVERNSAFLPDFDLNINAETKYIEDFLTYYGDLYVDLCGVFLNKTRLVDLYNILIVGSDDDAIISGISLYIDTGLQFLKETGVLE